MSVAKVTLNNSVIVDMTDATATADKVVNTYTAYVADGSKVTGTAPAGGGGITPSGTMSITSNGTYDVTSYASADVAVPTGVDIPVFTITFDSNWEAPQSITCNKTLNECYSLNYNGESSAFVIETDGVDEYKSTAFLYTVLMSSGIVTSLKYVAFNAYYDIVYTTNGITVNTPSDYPDELNATVNGTYTAQKIYKTVTVNVPTGTARTSSDLTVSGATVTAPAGLYTSAATKAVASGTAATPNTTITANPGISVSTAGLITATVDKSQSITPNITAGYITAGTSGTVTVNGSTTSQLSVQASTTVTPTETLQTAVAAGKYTTGAVNVAAIPNDYVGSGITTRSSSDLTVNAATVTAPAGYYSTVATKAVATKTTSDITGSYDRGYNSYMIYIAQGYYSQSQKSVLSGKTLSPVASKGTVSNHSISVTPSVTVDGEGYVGSGTRTGTAVTVSASELVSGTLNITSAGTSDVTNYASASVAAGSVGTPTAAKGSVSNHSITVTPSVASTTGFITGGSKSGTGVTVSASELVSGSQTITSNGTVDVTNLASVSVALTFSQITISSSNPSGGNNGDIWIKTS